MAVFTQEQYNTLVAAIATGALSIQYNGKMTTFRSLQEMLDLKRTMELDLGLSTKRTKVYNPITKGYGSN
jgi:hypothetical protein